MVTYTLLSPRSPKLARDQKWLHNPYHGLDVGECRPCAQGMHCILGVPQKCGGGLNRDEIYKFLIELSMQCPKRSYSLG